jgi:hypothetical protein
MDGNEERAGCDNAVVGHNGVDLDIFCPRAFELVVEAFQ